MCRTRKTLVTVSVIAINVMVIGFLVLLLTSTLVRGFKVNLPLASVDDTTSLGYTSTDPVNDGSTYFEYPTQSAQLTTNQASSTISSPNPVVSGYPSTPIQEPTISSYPTIISQEPSMSSYPTIPSQGPIVSEYPTSSLSSSTNLAFSTTSIQGSTNSSQSTEPTNRSKWPTKPTEKPPRPPIIGAGCPPGMFKCLAKLTRSNNLINKPIVPNFICIDKSRVCNGIVDCPYGEDESDRICRKPNNDKSGCYLCQGTTDQCIGMSKLCDKKFDCPLGDDEMGSWCAKQQKPQTGTLLDSKFYSNQYGQTNINIVNKESGNVKKDHTYPIIDHHSGTLHHRHNSHNKNNIETETDKPNNGENAVETNSGSGAPGVQDGVGFMFRVDNFVIYNSEVKMFNQESENVASGKPNGTRMAEQYQQMEQNYRGSV